MISVKSVCRNPLTGKVGLLLDQRRRVLECVRETGCMKMSITGLMKVYDCQLLKVNPDLKRGEELIVPGPLLLISVRQEKVETFVEDLGAACGFLSVQTLPNSVKQFSCALH